MNILALRTGERPGEVGSTLEMATIYDYDEARSWDCCSNCSCFGSAARMYYHSAIHCYLSLILKGGELLSLLAIFSSSIFMTLLPVNSDCYTDVDEFGCDGARVKLVTSVIVSAAVYLFGGSRFLEKLGAVVLVCLVCLVLIPATVYSKLQIIEVATIHDKSSMWQLERRLRKRQKDWRFSIRMILAAFFHSLLVDQRWWVTVTPNSLLLFFDHGDSPSRAFRCSWLWLKRSKIQTRHQRHCHCGCIVTGEISFSPAKVGSRRSGMFGTCHTKLQAGGRCGCSPQVFLDSLKDDSGKDE